MSTRYYELGIPSPNETFVEIGDVKLFNETGLVVLGNVAFDRFSPINNFQFSGCVANRGADGVLVIRTPMEEFRYRYKSILGVWLQLVPDRSETQGSNLSARWREDCRDYGYLGAIIILGVRRFIYVLSIGAILYLFWAACFIVYLFCAV